MDLVGQVDLVEQMEQVDLVEQVGQVGHWPGQSRPVQVRCDQVDLEQLLA